MAATRKCNNLVTPAKLLFGGFLITSLLACAGNGDSGTDSGNGDSAAISEEVPGPDSPDNSDTDSSCSDIINPGGSGTEIPAAPILNFEPRRTKIFRFDWTDVSGETEYRLLEDPDGVSGYTQLATIAADSACYALKNVFLPARINARYILQACNAIGCADSEAVTVSGTLDAAVGYVKASNTGAGDSFGWTIAISRDGTTLAIGAPLEDSAATGINGDQTDNSAANSGAVYVYTRSSDTAAGWLRQAYIKASNTEAGDEFGSTIALSRDGNTLAIGAPLEDGNAAGINGDQADNSTSGAGAVYVYTRDADKWIQQAYVKTWTDRSIAIFDRFGTAVALSDDGNILAVGADGEDGGATGVNNEEDTALADQSGAVYVYTRSGNSWSQQSYVKASNTDPRDSFGSAVALSGDGATLAVGAPEEDSPATGINGDQTDIPPELNEGGFGEVGAVYVYAYSADTWTQQAYVKASRTGDHNFFGNSIALSSDGDTLAVGAFLENYGGTGINNDTLDTADGSGAAYVYTRSAGTWTQQAYIKASNTESGDAFGRSVALSSTGDTLAVGAVFEWSSATGINGDQHNNFAESSGAAFLYTRNAGTWVQQAYVKASNTQAGDWFGTAVALSGNGDVLAIGAEHEDSIATDINGDQSDNSAENSGAVYLY